MAQYLEITNLTAIPVSAEYGEQVAVLVTIKNLWTTGIYIIPTGRVDGVDLTFGDVYKAVPSGSTASWSQFFTMPNKSVSVTVSAWYWVDGVGWIKNDEEVVSVQLEGAPEPGGKIEVVEFTAPSSAVAGTTITLTAKVKNTFSTTKTIKVVGSAGSVTLDYSQGSYSLAAGAQKSFSVQVTMPSTSIYVNAGTFYMDDNLNWLASDAATPKQVTVGEEEPEPELDVVITKVELEYDETRGTAPVSGVPLGNRGLVHVYRRNNGTTSQKVCVAWAVVDPDGVTVESYETCEAFTTAPGETDDFIGGRFNLSKAGTYRINVLLYVSPDLTNPVDTYNGVLCITAAQEPPNGNGGEGITTLTIFSGTPTLGVADMVENVPPVTGVKTGDVFKLRVIGVNPSTSAQRMGLHYIITRPDESVIEATVEESWPYTGGGDSHEFSEPSGLTEALEIGQAGDWTLLVELLAGGVAIDSWEGLIFSVTEAPIGTWDMLEMIPYLMVIMIMSMIMESMPGITETVKREAPKLAKKGVEEIKRRL